MIENELAEFEKNLAPQTSIEYYKGTAIIVFQT